MCGPFVTHSLTHSLSLFNLALSHLFVSRFPSLSLALISLPRSHLSVSLFRPPLALALSLYLSSPPALISLPHLALSRSRSLLRSRSRSLSRVRARFFSRTSCDLAWQHTARLSGQDSTGRGQWPTKSRLLLSTCIHKHGRSPLLRRHDGQFRKLRHRRENAPCHS